MTGRFITIIILGWLVGSFLRGVDTSAQNPALLYTVDSSSGLPVVVQTNGSGSLNTIGQ